MTNKPVLPLLLACLEGSLKKYFCLRERDALTVWDKLTGQQSGERKLQGNTVRFVL